MRNIDKLKTYLKETANQIRKIRPEYKEAQRNCTESWKLLGELSKLKIIYRHHHIAYCELRGRTRDQIEHPREYNEPNENYIDKIKKKYAWTEEEIATYLERIEKRKAQNAA